MALILMLAATAAAVVPASANETPLTAGYENPESAFLHKGIWYVSNFGGFTLEPSQTDGDGFISKIGPDELVSTRWVTGLHAPKGLRVHKGLLWVADVEQVVAIDLATGKVSRTIPVKGAPSLNDVDVDEATGHVYVTETFGDKIWRIAGNKATVFLSSPKLEAPNGILVEKGRLLVAAFGPNPDPMTFQTEQPGRVLHIDLATKAIHPISDRIGNLDGIERDGRDLLVTDFWGGQILRVHPDGTSEQVMRVLPTAADIGWDPNRRILGLPQMATNAVAFFQL
jgi:hypothetical protein